MGSKELIESLRIAGDEKIRVIRREADAEAEKVRAEASKRIEEIRANHEAHASAEAGERTAKILSEVGRRQRAQKLEAEKALSDRLFTLALSSLPLLRNAGYRDAFRAMAREIPPLPWRTVRVNPEDLALAREYFPKADVVPDKNISGGLEAMIEGGKVRVINTFEKRLERAWADMLPGLIKDVYREAAKRGTSSDS